MGDQLLQRGWPVGVAGYDDRNADLAQHLVGAWDHGHLVDARVGAQDGFDLDLISRVRREVTVPVIASGGAGRVEHFAPAVDAGADAVLAATAFHFGTCRISEVKESLAQAGHPVR